MNGKLAIGTRNQRLGDFLWHYEIGLRRGFFAALVFVGIKMIPPFFANYELEDSIKTEALQATYSTRTEDDIRAAIIKQARNYDIDADAQAGASDSRWARSAMAFSTLKPSTAFLSICPGTRPRSSSILRRRTKACFKVSCPGLCQDE
jgi:hypothetical protein